MSEFDFRRPNMIRATLLMALSTSSWSMKLNSRKEALASESLRGPIAIRTIYGEEVYRSWCDSTMDDIVHVLIHERKDLGTMAFTMLDIAFGAAHKEKDIRIAEN